MYCKKLQNFEQKCRERLFDIAACKCTSENCKCPKARKVAREEKEFLHDQRTNRVMIIGGLDKTASMKLNKWLERKLNTVNKHLRYRKHLDLSNKQTLADSSDQISTMESEADLVGLESHMKKL